MNEEDAYLTSNQWVIGGLLLLSFLIIDNVQPESMEGWSP